MLAARTSRFRDTAWLLLWMIVSSLWCVSASTRLGATFDEPTYLTLGLESWRTGSCKSLLNLGTMPLPPRLETLPLYLWERWRGQAFDVAVDLEHLLPVARLAALPFWWLLLAYGWLAGRQIAGAWGGRLALVFLACEPNLLAHASLATTDVAVSACLLALLYHFRSARNSRWLRRVLVPALWFAVAVAAKASGLVFGILGLLVLEMERGWTEAAIAGRGRLRSAVLALTGKAFRRDVGQIVALGLAGTFWYCGCDWLASPSFVMWAQELPNGITRSVIVTISEHLCIFSNAGAAIVRQFRHNVQG
ncbi:MAG: hypothetical protein ACRELF_26505, partial [Gemmataceae bacterium]